VSNVQKFIEMLGKKAELFERSELFSRRTWR